ncbi:MAG TPA: lipoprotein insertase outer membrane protein LolB [Gammaproteobacteria bacterium]|nr:lipoprotein insertase outer membrane protein LolB [Gammaproteobacteria bacterium]
MTRGLAPLSGATLTAALLAACAHLPVGDDGLSYEQRRTRLEAVAAWEMRGRLAVQTGDGAFQGRFSWQQRADALELAVRGPLGAGVLEVNGTPSALKVTARGDTRVLEDPETQLSELLGWWLPVGSLHAWLLGLPDPKFKASTELGNDGTLATLEQRLWRVAFASYQLAPEKAGAESRLLVPRRIDLTHGELHLRLTIDDWHSAAAP